MKYVGFIIHAAFTLLLLSTVPTDSRWWVWVAYYGFTFSNLIMCALHGIKIFEKKK